MTRTRTHLVAVLLVAILSTGCASRALFRTAQVSVVATQAADLHSTHLALAGGYGREANPFLPTAWQGQLVIKGGITSVELWLSERLSKTHPVLATIVLSALAGGTALVSVRNYRITARGQE